VAADADRLNLALTNLIDNAIAHTPAGGTITLAAEPATDGQVTLAVADNGVGIPPEHLPHVFERFFRVPGLSAEGGTGLGLSIVKEIVEAHHGQVTCESEPGRGTTFRITLPAWADGGASR
jgi:signal transduction histidine kinase